MPKGIATKVNYFPAEQIKNLLPLFSTHRFGLIFTLSTLYGLRRSEVLGLKWENINFKNKSLTLCHSHVTTFIDGKSALIEKDYLKNDSSYRILPLFPYISELFKQQYDRQRQWLKDKGKNFNIQNIDHVFTDDYGRIINPESISLNFKNLLKRNHLPIIRFHELRHSCACLLLTMGFDLKEIQVWLGHSSYSTTADFYMKLNFSHKVNIANQLESFVHT